MEIMPLEVYSRQSNSAVIKPPGRSFPGCVIQGDSLHILCRLGTDIAHQVQSRHPADEELLGDVQELVHSLVDRLLHDQRVLQQHGIPLPYNGPVTQDDLIRLLPESED